jgi:hypothetical protein
MSGCPAFGLPVAGYPAKTVSGASLHKNGLLNFSPTILYRELMKKSIILFSMSKYSEGLNFIARGRNF